MSPLSTLSVVFLENEKRSYQTNNGQYTYKKEELNHAFTSTNFAK
jgi:hypothetical protein